MKFISTRGGESTTLDGALVAGIASDGGLFLPDELPQFSCQDFTGHNNIQSVATKMLRPFFDGSSLQEELQQIAAETFHFPIPLKVLSSGDEYLGLLELFHGPTAAFKDVGAAFLAACLSRLEGNTETPLTILVATSGDTGGAVAAAFNERSGMRVVVLFPDGRVSDRQAHQLTCWGDNVLSLAVDGSFDECQALVKATLANASLTQRFRFSSANSINIGRLLPQSIYYAKAALDHWSETGKKPGFIIPTGNLGNGLACVLAREMGFPVADIIFTTNANRTIPDFLGGDDWQPRSSIATLASAMDVGNPSNMERLRAVADDDKILRQSVRAIAVDDAAIEQDIRLNQQEFGTATCPHTATATHAWRAMENAQRQQTDWIAVATAHAAKFEQIVEPIIGRPVPVPPELANILARTTKFVRIDADEAALLGAMDACF